MAAAVRDAGWLELRDGAGGAGPLASGVEAAIVADALGASVADVAFAGPLLAADLARRAGVRAPDGAVAAFAADLCSAARVDGVATTAPLFAVDTTDDSTGGAYLLVAERDGYRLAVVPVDAAGGGVRRGSHARGAARFAGSCSRAGRRPAAIAHR